MTNMGLQGKRKISAFNVVFIAAYFVIFLVFIIHQYWSVTFSWSPDYGTHNSWIKAILDSGGLGVGYPPLAHWLGAFVSRFVGSTIIAMNIVTIISLVFAIAGLLYLVGQAGTLNSILTIGMLFVFYILFRSMPLVGYEIIVSFYYSELVATAYMMGGLAIFLKAGMSINERIAFSILFSFVGFLVYPIPVLVYFGATSVFLFLEIFESNRRMFGALALYVVSTIAIFITNPSTRFMVETAKINGWLSFSLLTRTPTDLGEWGVLFILVSFVMSLFFALLKLFNRLRQLDSKIGLLLNSITLSAASIALFQFILFLLKLGNPYAVKKNFFILGTFFFIELMYLLCEAVRYILRKRIKLESAFSSALWPLLFSPLLVFSLLGNSTSWDEISLLKYEKDASYYYEHILSTTGESNLVARYPINSTFNYLITVSDLRMPNVDAWKYCTADNVALSKEFYGNIITKRDNYDGKVIYRNMNSQVVSFQDYLSYGRNLVPGKSLQFSDFNSQGALLSGFSDTENWGVWSDAKASEMVLGLRTYEDVELSFTVIPFLPRPGSTLAVNVFGGGKKVGIWHFSHGETRVAVALKVPGFLLQKDGVLRLKFEYSQTLTPKSAGTNSQDNRELALGFVEVGRK